MQNWVEQRVSVERREEEEEKALSLWEQENEEEDLAWRERAEDWEPIRERAVDWEPMGDGHMSGSWDNYCLVYWMEVDSLSNLEKPLSLCLWEG